MYSLDKAPVKYKDSIQDLCQKFSTQAKSLQGVEAVQAKLQHMVDVEQFVRLKDVELYDSGQGQDAALRAFGMHVDRINTKELKEIIKHHGWPVISRFGEQAAFNAWLLVQHADDDLEFQKEVLGQLETLYKKSEVDPSHYAYLYDRIAVREKRPQRYGTQFGWNEDGVHGVKPLEDPDKVEEFRQEMGMDSFADYEASMKESYGAPPKLG